MQALMVKLKDNAASFRTTLLPVPLLELHTSCRGFWEDLVNLLPNSYSVSLFLQHYTVF